MRRKAKYIIIGFMTFFSVFIISGTIWAFRNFADLTIQKAIFHLKVPLEGTNQDFIGSFVKECIIISIILTIIYILLAINWFKTKTIIYIKIWNKNFKIILIEFYRKIMLPFSICILGIALIYCSKKWKIIKFIEYQFEVSNIYENYYADPKEVSMTFPEEKRNLIYVYLESIENTYLGEELGGGTEENLIPELYDLMKKNISFSDKDGKAARQIEGTGWTIAAMVAQTSGVPLILPISGNSYGEFSTFLPGVYSLGDILEKEGYSQMLLVGSDAGFGGRSNYFSQHGNYKIWDYYTAVEQGKINKDYYVWWGFEDTKLFSYAKEELLNLSKKNQPFNFTMLTADTHHIGGYLCEDCENKYQEQYSNVIACSSKQVYEFVSWIQEQDFYDNTTIIIAGDHLSMDPEYFKKIDSDYIRTTLNIIINPNIKDYNIQNKSFCTIDMFPTTLAALGVEIKGEMLGLGTNLFSDKKTLCEILGVEKLSEEVSKKSDFYNAKILGMNE